LRDYISSAELSKSKFQTVAESLMKEQFSTIYGDGKPALWSYGTFIDKETGEKVPLEFSIRFYSWSHLYSEKQAIRVTYSASSVQLGDLPDPTGLSTALTRFPTPELNSTFTAVLVAPKATVASVAWASMFGLEAPAQPWFDAALTHSFEPALTYYEQEVKPTVEKLR
jgi:hypothetical protein